MDPKDPYRAANLLIQQHGAEAKNHVIQRILDMRNAGDERGEWAWTAVFDAVLVLQSTHLPDGRAVH